MRDRVGDLRDAVTLGASQRPTGGAAGEMNAVSADPTALRDSLPSVSRGGAGSSP